MKFVLNPSLEQLALVKVVISLWNQNDVRALIAKHNFIQLYSSERWVTIEERVIEKVQELSLPQILKQNVLAFIKPIGLEISTWMRFNHTYLHVNLPTELRWTPHGTVDRKKTAEVLVGNENLDVSTRYKLACIYCLEDAIIQLWNNMPEDLKESDWDKFAIISFWSRNRMRWGLGNVPISYKDVFLQSAISGNKIAAEYFLQKLTPLEREESLEETAKHVQDADTLCILLSKMDEEQQIEVFKNNPFRVLSCFLKWPFQSFFIGIANCMWDFLSRLDLECSLTAIILKVYDGYKDWNYQKLFREVWQESPSALKSLITNEIDTSFLILPLLRIKDKEHIRLILKDASFTVKEKLISSDAVKDFFYGSIYDNEWNILEFCIQECLPSKSAMLKFKLEFEKRDPYVMQHSERKHKWDQLFRSSADSIFKYDKRNIEEGESSSSKKFRCLQ